MSHPPTIKESVTLPCNLGKELEAATDNNPDIEAAADHTGADLDTDDVAMLPDNTSVESVMDGAFQRRMQNISKEDYTTRGRDTVFNHEKINSQTKVRTFQD